MFWDVPAVSGVGSPVACIEVFQLSSVIGDGEYRTSYPVKETDEEGGSGALQVNVMEFVVAFVGVRS